MAAPETSKPRPLGARPDSDAPRSGVRLVAPLRVPRPPRAPRVEADDTFVDGDLDGIAPQATVTELRARDSRPPGTRDSRPPTSRAPSMPRLPAPMTVPPPPSAEGPVSRSGRAAIRPRSERRRGTVAPSDRGSAKSTAAQSFRSLVSTAVDWPIAKPDAADATPASVAPESSPPPSLTPTFGIQIPDARSSLPAFTPPAELLVPVTVTGTLDLEPVADDDAELDPAFLAREARRTKLLGFVIGVVLALAVLALYALAS